MSLDFSLYYICDNNEIEVFSANITHNLNKMAMEAGIYECLWRPDEHKIIFAKNIIHSLEEGLKKLKNKPEYYKQFNAENGWGLYEHFVPFVESVLEACNKYPNAMIKVSR